MKVLHIISVREIGGAEKHFISLLSGLKKLGVEVAASCIPDGPLIKMLSHQNIKLFPVDFSGKWNPLNIFKVITVINEFRPALIHTHLSKGALIGGAAAKLKGIKVVSTKHNLSKSWYYNFADRIIAVSEIIKEELVKDGFNKDNITTIYNGVERDFARVLIGKDVLKIKGKYGIRENSFVVGIIARLAPVKQHYLFLKAAKIALDKGADIQFLLCGDGILMDELKKMSYKLGIEKNVVFTGFVEDMQEIYSVIDISVLTSKTEGMPMSIIESMAFGVPVVASKVGGIPEVVNHGENGFLFEPGNHQKLAERILTLYNNEELRRRFSLDAKKTAREKFMADGMINQTFELYKRLCNGSGKP